MGIFSNAFRKIPQILRNGPTITNPTTGQGVLQAINRYKAHLSSDNGAQDTLISGFSSVLNDVSDHLLDGGTLLFSSTLSDFDEISDENTTILVSSLAEAINGGVDEISNQGVTLTDAVGRAYNIIDVRSRQFIFDGQEILFSVSSNPSRISEGLLIRDVNTGKYKLNRFIRTSNFVKDEGRRVMPDTLYQLVRSMFMIVQSRDFPNWTIKQYLNKLISLSYDGNIQDSLTILCSRHSVTTGSTIMDTAMALWTKIDEEYPLPAGKGSIQSLWNVIRDSIESSVLNQYILRTCDCIVGGFNKATEITTIITEGISNKYKSIRRFTSGISTAFNKGGVYGVACYIISYIKELVASQVQDDGTLKFTDNSKLVPEIYIAGIVSALATTAVVLLGIIVSIFSKIAGVAITAVGAILSNVVKAFQYDYSSTNAALNLVDDAYENISPFGLYQQTFPKIEGSDDLIALINNGDSLCYAEIPGGYVLIGPDTDSSNMRSEFHPAVCDSHAVIEHLYDFLISQGSISVQYNSATDKIDLTFNGFSREALRLKILELWAEYAAPFGYSNDESGTLSDYHDQLMRRNVSGNLFIGQLFISCCLSTPYVNRLYESVSFVVSSAVVNNSRVLAIDPSESSQCLWYGLLYNNTYRNMGTDSLGHSIVFGWNAYYDPMVDFTWIETIEKLVTPYEVLNYTAHYMTQIFTNNFIYNELIPINTSVSYSLCVPRYDKTSFWTAIIITGVIAAATAATIAVATFAVKKKLQKVQAINQAKVQQAHEALVKNPNDETYLAYRKAVKKNNLFANFVGGSKYDYVNYWNDPADNTGSLSGETISTLDGLNGVASSFTALNASMSDVSETEDVSATREYVVKHFNRLIRGTE